MDFTITMPEKLGNAYARRNADVKWVFAVNEAEATPTPAQTGVPQGETSGGGSGGGTTLAGTHEEKSPESSAIAPIKTGDEASMRAPLVLLLFSACLIVALCSAKRRMNHEK